MCALCTPRMPVDRNALAAGTASPASANTGATIASQAGFSDTRIGPRPDSAAAVSTASVSTES